MSEHDDVPTRSEPYFVLKSIGAMLVIAVGSIAVPSLVMLLLQSLIVRALVGTFAGALVIRAIVRHVNRRDDPRFASPPGAHEAGAGS